MSKIDINQIPRDHQFEGYLWLSNGANPIILDKVPIPSSIDFSADANPFVVEAELWDKADSKSYAIHQVGNRTICQCYDVKSTDVSNKDFEKKAYASHRMKDHPELRFLEYWEEKTDDACLGMPTLVMTKHVFVGFKHKED